jgi:Las17-binding protein actin regulator
LKHIIYLIYDERTLQAMAGDVGDKSTQLEVSIGNWGRTAEITTVLTNQGLGGNVGLSYSIFGGVSLEGALCNPRHRANEQFYSKKVTPREIWFQPDALQLPDGTLYPEIIAKLTKLCSGEAIYEPTEQVKALRESIRQQVDQEGEEALKEEQVEYVNSHEEPSQLK